MTPRLRLYDFADWLRVLAAHGKRLPCLGFYSPQNDTVSMWRLTANEKRRAHEWGHARAHLGHLPWYAFDVMSGRTPLRVFDRHRVMARSAAWRREVRRA